MLGIYTSLFLRETILDPQNLQFLGAHNVDFGKLQHEKMHNLT